jgi:hypothetical protein
MILTKKKFVTSLSQQDLRSKAFSYNAEANSAKNYYVWEDANAAKNFFTEENISNIGNIYGVRPSVEFLEVATLVDNHS